MSRQQWSGFPPPSVPRPVTGGLQARSVRGDIGEQWWSRRFIEVLESLALGSRLTRGRTYARRGQVISLEVTAGEVRASVQGSRRTPYRVTIGLPPLPELTWAKVEVALAEQAIHSARLLAGEMPADLEKVFAAAGAPLFPQRAADLAMRCSCPDFAVPCKHLAATFYLLAESFDEDPFRILAWRGRERSSLLNRLRDLRGNSPSELPDDSEADRPRRVGAAMALDDDMLADGTARDASGFAFWEGTPPPELPTHSELPVDFVLRQLPVPGAVLGGVALTNHLRPLYARLAEANRRGAAAHRDN